MARLLLALILITTLASSVAAVAPTEEAIAKWKAQGVWEEKMATWEAFKARGGCSPNEHSVFRADRSHDDLSADAAAVETVNVCVIMVQFTDNLMSAAVNGTPALFDSVLFSDGTIDTAGAIINPTGSMTDYYREVSYGNFHVKGTIYGPYMAPNTYAYYVGSDDGLSLSDDLVRWLVNTYDSEIDFTQHSRNGSTCDGLVIIHAGRGAEEGVFGIWSHKYTIGNVLKDGITISNYTMNPEESGNALSPIGVFCHEYGHFLGLPDLYDIQYTYGSNGAGMWSLMATGNYLGGSKRPAHLDGWCKSQVGFVDVVDVPATNLKQAAIPAVQFTPTVYRLKNATTTDNEYFIVENRQKLGFDLNLPSEGLCIWHFDNGAPNAGGSNIYPPYRIAMEQADGAYQLEFAENNVGDAGDPFPGAANNRNFHNYSLPGSHLNDAGSPQYGLSSGGISVWEISNSDSIMYADLDVSYSRPYIVPAPPISGSGFVFNDDAPRGDGDGLPEAGETIHFYCWIRNVMRPSYNLRATLTSLADGVTFSVPSVSFNTDLLVDPKSNSTPIVFTVSDTITSVLDSFFLSIITDSLPGNTNGSEFTTVFGIEQQVGATQVLIVDADGGEDYQAEYQEALRNMRIPTRTWNKVTQGIPSATDLNGYSSVFWHTGDTSATPFFAQSEIDAMKGFLDNGGNLFLATIGIDDLQTEDSAFTADYFRVNYAGGEFWPTMLGISGSQIGNGTQYFLANLQIPVNFPIPYVNVLSGAEACFKSGKAGVTRYWGTSYSSGTYKTVWVGMPPELINDNAVGYFKKDTIIARAISYFGGQATDVYDGSPFTSLPQSFTLAQNYPNPFNPTTSIQYTLRSTGDNFANTPRTRLAVYNALGQEVVTLVDKVQIPGTYQVEWDGRDHSGKRVSSGIYFYQLRRGNEAQSMKMVLVK